MRAIDQAGKFFDFFLLAVLCACCCIRVRRAVSCFRCRQAARRIRLCRFVLHQLLCHILGDIDEHRTLAPAVCDAEGVSERISQILLIVHKIVVLCDRERHACNTDLLESVSADQMIADVRGDKHRRYAVHIGRRDTGHQICRARSARCKSDANLAGRSCVAIGGMCRPLLMCGQYMSDLIAVLV